MLSFLQNCALKKLEELSISYNWLGDSAGTSLAAILNGCPILTTLRIESCGLTSHVTAQGKEFPVALKGSCESYFSSVNLGFWKSDFIVSAFCFYEDKVVLYLINILWMKKT